ncbi:MAG: tetratricopeptide repeat protein, partial [Chloroflexota bacterium]
ATTLNNIGGVYSDLGDKESALSYYEQALPIRREVGDKSGEAVTSYNIGMIHYEQGDLDEAIRYVGRCVELDEIVQHPDLESDRRTLEQLKQLRDGGEDTVSEQERLVQAMVQAYQEGGETAFRETLSQAGASDEQIESLVAQVKSAVDVAEEEMQSEQQRLAQAMAQAYQEGGETGLRKMLSQAGASAEQIESLVAQIKSAFGDES